MDKLSSLWYIFNDVEDYGKACRYKVHHWSGTHRINRTLSMILTWVIMTGCNDWPVNDSVGLCCVHHWIHDLLFLYILFVPFDGNNSWKVWMVSRWIFCKEFHCISFGFYQILCPCASNSWNYTCILL